MQTRRPQTGKRLSRTAKSIHMEVRKAKPKAAKMRGPATGVKSSRSKKVLHHESAVLRKRPLLGKMATRVGRYVVAQGIKAAMYVAAAMRVTHGVTDNRMTTDAGFVISPSCWSRGSIALTRKDCTLTSCKGIAGPHECRGSAARWPSPAHSIDAQQ